MNNYRPCVGIILLNKAKLVLIGQRIDSDINSLFSWQMPQGGIDPDEKPEEAAFRELNEEVGTNNASIIYEYEPWLKYTLPVNLAKKLWKGKYIGQTQKWFVLKFLGEDSEINIHTKTPEFKKWKWIKTDQLVSVAVPFKKDIYKIIVDKIIPQAINRF